MATLYVLHDRQCDKVEVGLELTIGRSYSNRLRLEGAEISRAHAIIYRRGTEYIIRDLDSKNGVRVNGVRKAKHVLERSDRLTVGKYVMLFDPPEPVDLSEWLDDRKPEDTGAGYDTALQRRHQHCPVRVIEDSFVDSQVAENFSIARASLSLRFAHQAIVRLGGEKDAEEVCRRALDWAVDSFAAQRGLIALNKDGEPATVAMFDVKNGEEILIHQRILDWLAKKGEALISVEAWEEGEDENARRKVSKDAHRMGISLMKGDRPRGFVYLESDPPVPPFTLDDLQKLFCIGIVTSRRLDDVES